MAEDVGIGWLADGVIGEASERHWLIEKLRAIQHDIRSVMAPGGCLENQSFAVAAILDLEKRINRLTAGLVNIGKQTQKRPRQASYGLTGGVRQKHHPKKN